MIKKWVCKSSIILTPSNLKVRTPSETLKSVLFIQPGTAPIETKDMAVAKKTGLGHKHTEEQSWWQ